MLGYQLAAGNETAKERVAQEARLPAGSTADDYGFGLLRADGRTPRPTYTWLKETRPNAALLQQSERTIDIEAYIPDGATPVDYAFDYEWRRPWMLIKAVPVNTLTPTIIRLQPASR